MDADIAGIARKQVLVCRGNDNTAPNRLNCNLTCTSGLKGSLGGFNSPVWNNRQKFSCQNTFTIILLKSRLQFHLTLADIWLWDNGSNINATILGYVSMDDSCYLYARQSPVAFLFTLLASSKSLISTRSSLVKTKPTFPLMWGRSL